jgi:cytochrome P450
MLNGLILKSRSVQGVTMIVELDRPHTPSVFEAGLPSIDYTREDDPEKAHAIIRNAREQAPIALGPFGPELLTYELVHTVLRDPRFHTPPGFILAAQGITSGPLWDRVVVNILSLSGEEHHRLRRLVAKAFTPRNAGRLRSTITVWSPTTSQWCRNTTPRRAPTTRTRATCTSASPPSSGAATATR